MTSENTVADAERRLAALARKYPDSPLKARDMESDLLGFLELVQAAPEDRDAFASLFGEIIRGERAAPEWLVAYCMHSLRWPEVRAVAEVEIQRGQPATLSLASEVLDAFDDDWIGRDLFDAYASAPAQGPARE